MHTSDATNTIQISETSTIPPDFLSKSSRDNSEFAGLSLVLNQVWLIRRQRLLSELNGMWFIWKWTVNIRRKVVNHDMTSDGGKKLVTLASVRREGSKTNFNRKSRQTRVSLEEEEIFHPENFARQCAESLCSENQQRAEQHQQQHSR